MAARRAKQKVVKKKAAAKKVAKKTAKKATKKAAPRKKKSLVIVESPAKARTINKYLGKDFVVKSSVGHVRDLPVSGNGKKVDPKARAKAAGKQAAKGASARAAWVFGSANESASVGK